MIPTYDLTTKYPDYRKAVADIGDSFTNAYDTARDRRLKAEQVAKEAERRGAAPAQQDAGGGMPAFAAYRGSIGPPAPEPMRDSGPMNPYRATAVQSPQDPQGMPDPAASRTGWNNGGAPWMPPQPTAPKFGTVPIPYAAVKDLKDMPDGPQARAHFDDIFGAGASHRLLGPRTFG